MANKHRKHSQGRLTIWVTGSCDSGMSNASTQSIHELGLREFRPLRKTSTNHIMGINELNFFRC